MPPNTDGILTAKVEKIVSGGLALLRIDGEVIFVEGALPGETIQVRLLEKHSGVRKGQLVKVVEASQHRVVPACAHYGVCGGCDFMHLDVESQRSIKRTVVQESFKRIAKIDLDLPPIVSGRPWEYRSRVQIHREADVVGFRASSSSRLVRIEHCKVAVPALNSLFQSNSIPEGRINAFAAHDVAYFEGKDKNVTVSLRGKRLKLSLAGFFQSNLEVLEFLLDDVLKLVPEQGQSQRALDLFCGSGLFGSFLADRFESVICVEENAQALALARENVVGPLHEFYATTLEKWVTRMARTPTKRKGPLANFVVVDPPRAGLSNSVRSFLCQHAFERLIYVSCNPDTLARDTASLTNSGYVLKGIKLYDFYPQTSHIEAMAYFERA